MRPTTASVDGMLVPIEQATVSAYDRAFRSGEGVFETFRAYGTHVFRRDAHLERAVSGARQLGFDLPDVATMATWVQAVVDDNVADGEDAAVRLVATPGDVDPFSPFPGAPVGTPRVVVTVHDLVLDPARRRDGIRAVLVPWGREAAEVKSVSYLPSTMARREATRRGVEAALLTDGRGNVLEAATANVFAVVYGVLVTPPVDGAILPGVTRQVALELADEAGVVTSERALHHKDLTRASEAFLTATTQELTPLVEVDGRAVGDGTPGPVTRRLQEAFGELVRREASGPRQ